MHAFSTSYSLHRILLDRAPFFSSALSEPWFESTAKDITLYPEDIDSNISQRAFELALKRLYGCAVVEEEEKEAAGLLATGCWLEMTDLVESSVQLLMRNMKPSNLSSLIDLVTRNYYGKAGERLLASARAMLYREGWEMPPQYWDDISGAIIRDIVGGDGFFVPGEWERWLLAKRLFNRRLKVTISKSDHQDVTDMDGAAVHGTGPPPDGHSEAASHRNSSSSNEEEIRCRCIYHQPDLVALRQLLDLGIHYTHLTFEQLQHILSQCDAGGIRLVEPGMVMKALWMSTELRQGIVNATEEDVELGLTHQDLPSSQNSKHSSLVDEKETKDECGSPAFADSDSLCDEPLDHNTGTSCSASAEPYTASRKFWIPAADSTRIIGDKYGMSSTRRANDGTSTCAIEATRRGSARHPLLMPARYRPKAPNSSSDGQVSSPTPKISVRKQSYSIFPPCRFSVEFPNPRSVKEDKRVYSRIVWYAGSRWNVYIQKIQSTKNLQLGVYLHRVREKKGEDPLGGTAAMRTLDGAVRRLERDMLLRRQEIAIRAERLQQGDPQEEQGNSSSDNNNTAAGTRDLTPHLTGSNSRSPYGVTSRTRKAQQIVSATTARRDPWNGDSASPLVADQMDSDDEQNAQGDLKKTAMVNPAIPPYVDARPTIKTYFKIYQMSPDGRTLSVHKSAPDVFSFCQSWVGIPLPLLFNSASLLGELFVDFCS